MGTDSIVVEIVVSNVSCVNYVVVGKFIDYFLKSKNYSVNLCHFFVWIGWLLENEHE